MEAILESPWDFVLSVCWKFDDLIKGQWSEGFVKPPDARRATLRWTFYEIFKFIPRRAEEEKTGNGLGFWCQG